MTRDGLAPAHHSMMPRRKAMQTAWLRLAAFNFFTARSENVRTVCSWILRNSAISVTVLPWENCCMTAISRGVRPRFVSRGFFTIRAICSLGIPLSFHMKRSPPASLRRLAADRHDVGLLPCLDGEHGLIGMELLLDLLDVAPDDRIILVAGHGLDELDGMGCLIDARGGRGAQAVRAITRLADRGQPFRDDV